MNQRTYQIVETFDPLKDYGVHVQKGVAKCLSALKKGDIINSGQFLKKYTDILNQKASPLSQLKYVSVQTTQNTPDSLEAKVSVPDQTGPKVIMFNIPATTINVANLKDLGVMYDGKSILPAPDMDAILHAKSTDSPSFAILVTQSGVQVLVLVPHFSTHTITITNISKVIPAVPEFPFAILALIIATFSIVLISKIRHL